MSNNESYAWGGNWLDQLGDGTYINRYEPIQTNDIFNSIAISASEENSLILKLVETQSTRGILFW